MPPKKLPDLRLVTPHERGIAALGRARKQDAQYSYVIPVSNRPHDIILPKGRNLWYLVSRTDQGAAKATDMTLPAKTLSKLPTRIVIT